MPEKDQGTMLTWDALMLGAKQLGEEYYEFLTNVGREAVMKIVRTGIAIYPDSAQMEPYEAALAAYRYFSVTMDKSPDEFEKDKYIELYFNLYFHKNRAMAELQLLTMGPGESSESMRKVDAIENMIAKLGFPRKLSKTDADRLSGDFQYGAEIQQYLFDSQDMIVKLKSALTEVKTDLRSAVTAKKPVDNKLVATLEKRHKTISDKIEKMEKALGLEVTHGVDSAADILRAIQAKVERFAAANSGYFERTCEACGYHGPLNLRKPEDKGVDGLHLRWGWQCPSCKQIMANDKKHPYFDGNVLWSHRAWELVEQGDRFTILNMAYILGESPYGVMWVAEKVFNKTIPDHIREDFNEWERTYLQTSVGGMSTEEYLQDDEGDGEPE